MSVPGDDQHQAEQYDESKIATDAYDQNAEDYPYPPDGFQGADDYGTTPQEERFDEPMAERDERYEPEPLVEVIEHEGDQPDQPQP